MAAASFLLALLAMNIAGGLGQKAGGATPPPPGSQLPCVQQLLPCQPFLKEPNPPASCCVPMDEMVKNQPQCLCQIYNNAELLKSLNITQNDCLQLAKSCHANADISICKNAPVPPTPSTPTPVTPTPSVPTPPAPVTPTPSAPTPPTPSASSNSSTSSPPKSASVLDGAHCGQSAAIASLVLLLLSNMGFI